MDWHTLPVSRHISVAPDILGFLDPVAAEGAIFKGKLEDVLDYTHSQVVVAFKVGESWPADDMFSKVFMDRRMVRTLFPCSFYPC